MPKHTPAPWTAAMDGIVQTYNGSTRKVLVWGPHFRPGSIGQAVDDARLISAAPELLAACNEAVKVLNDLCIGHMQHNLSPDHYKACIATVAMLQKTIKRAESKI